MKYKMYVVIQTSDTVKNDNDKNGKNLDFSKNVVF